MSLFVIGKDELIIPTSLRKRNGLKCNITLESLMTKKGLVIPRNMDSLNIVDYFNEEDIDWTDTIFSKGSGVLIRENGSVTEWSNTERMRKGFSRTVIAYNPIAVGEGIYHVRAANIGDESVMSSAMSLCDNMHEALALFESIRMCYVGQYRVVKMQDLLNYINNGTPVPDDIVNPYNFIKLHEAFAPNIKETCAAPISKQATAKRLNRQADIRHLLNTGEDLNIGELTVKYGVGKGTIVKDIKHIKPE